MSRNCSCGQDWFNGDDEIDVGAVTSAARRGKIDDALHELEREIPALADFCDAVRKRLAEAERKS